jgi:hypothetical protein
MTSKTRSRIAVVCPCGKKYRCSYKRIGKSVTCRSCGQKMDVVEPTVPTDAELLETDSATGPPSNNQTLRILGIILLLLAVLASTQVTTTTVRGPEFLVVFVGLLIVCWISSELFRVGADKVRVAIVPVIVFNSVGIARIWYGLQHQMHKFSLLVIAMHVGSILILLGSRRIFPNGGRVSQFVVPFVFGLGVGVLLIVWSIFGWIAVPGLVALGYVVWKYDIKGEPHRAGGGSGASGGCGGGGSGGGGCGGCGGG